QWDEASPGFVEVDLVAHEGGNSRGDYAQTLDLTDVCSGWTELTAVKNKAQVWVFEALEQIRSRLPFPLLGGKKKMELRVGLALMVMLALAVGHIKAGQKEKMRSLVQRAA
ncbi:MAG: hypothetical protein ACRD1R_07225, partial [Acidobacteriota bacterium]